MADFSEIVFDLCKERSENDTEYQAKYASISYQEMSEAKKFEFRDEIQTRYPRLLEKVLLRNMRRERQNRDRHQDVSKEDFKEGIGYRHRLPKKPLFSHVHYDQGDAATCQACDPPFIDALFEDLHRLTLYIGSRFYPAELHSQTPVRREEIIGAANDLGIIVDHFLRLKTSPRLFPSLELKKNFRTQITRASTSIGNLQNLLFEMDEVKVLELQLIKRSDPNCGKNPWNYWLNNWADSPGTWVGVEQRVSSCGHKITRNITHMHHKTEIEFREAGFLDDIDNDNKQDDDENEDEEEESGETHEQDRKDNEDELDPPGEAFRHMTWSGFVTVPDHALETRMATAKYDDKGTTLEQLSMYLSDLQNRRNGRKLAPKQIGDNFPYWRFAMGYDA